MEDGCKHSKTNNILSSCPYCAYELGFKKALEIVIENKPEDIRGCNDPQCCGNPPDAEAAFENVIDILNIHIKEYGEEHEI
jgi:hypothetical protein